MGFGDAFIDALDFLSGEIRKSTYKIELGDDYDNEYRKSYAEFSNASNETLISYMELYDKRDVSDYPQADALHDVLKKRGLL